MIIEKWWLKDWAFVNYDYFTIKMKCPCIYPMVTIFGGKGFVYPTNKNIAFARAFLE